MDGHTVAAVVIAVLGSDVIKEIVKGLFGKTADFIAYVKNTRDFSHGMN